MNARNVCLYLAVRIGRWNDRRLADTDGPVAPFLWHTIDRLVVRLHKAAQR